MIDLLFDVPGSGITVIGMSETEELFISAAGTETPEKKTTK